MKEHINSVLKGKKKQINHDSFKIKHKLYIIFEFSNVIIKNNCKFEFLNL